MTIDELFAKAQSAADVQLVQFVIDENLRIVSVPETATVFGVVTDKDVNTVSFMINRYYTGVDLSEFAIRISFTNANNEMDFFNATDIVTDESTVTFSWTMGASVFKYQGTIHFAVNFIKADSDGTVQQAYNTTIAEGQCLVGLNVNSADVPESDYSDLIIHIQQQIQNEGATQISAVNSTGSTQVQAVQTAGTEAAGQVTQTGQQQVQAVKDEGTTQTNAVAEAGSAQVQAVQQAGSQQITDIGDAGAQQVQAVNSAGDTKLDQINAAIAHPPQPNTTTGFWQVWNAETGQYEDTTALYQGGYYTPSVAEDGTLTWTGSQAGMPELPSANIRGPQGLGVPTPSASNIGQMPTINDTGDGYLLTGPYAPLEASIRPTANGNPAVCEDSIAWSFQGLKVYGKSTQDGTPSPENPVPIVSAGDSGSIALSITDGADQSQSLTLSTPNGLPGIPVDNGGNYTDSTGQQWVSDVVDFDAEKYVQNCCKEIFDGSSDENWDSESIVDPTLVRFSLPIADMALTPAGLCNRLPWVAAPTVNLKKECIGGNTAVRRLHVIISKSRLNDETIESFKTWLSDHPLTVIYQLSAPIESVAEASAAYRSLTTYSDTTVVSTAEPVAGIEARYVADGTAWIENKLATLTASTTQTSQVVNTMLGAE